MGCVNVTISNSKKEHLIVPTYSHETVQTIWQGWKKWGWLSTSDAVVHKLLEQCWQKICLEEHFTLDSYLQRLSFTAW